MRNFSFLLLTIIFLPVALATPVLEMNRAFMALADLIPYLTQRESFMEKKNEKVIHEKITELQKAFKSARHDSMMKEDLFAPSYAVVNESLDQSLSAFAKGKKDFAQWRLKEITSHCLDCHTRLPATFSSSFQNGELSINPKKFPNVYNLGIAQFIVRRYTDAKNSFIRSIQDRIIAKDYREIILPFKQLLVIETKVLKDPASSIALFTPYVDKKEMPEDVKKTLKAWIGQLNHWKTSPYLKDRLADEKNVDEFIKKVMVPLRKNLTLGDASDVDLLISSGLLSNYLFENPESKKAPEISFWLGWAESRLKREDFFGSGNLFLKQCVKRYPRHPVAKDCLAEYRENVEFEFSGSAGTDIPADVEKELSDLSKLLKVK